MFESIHQELGILLAKQKVKIIFNYKGDLEITSIAAFCGCTQSEWDKDNKRIIIIFTPAPMSHHLYLQGKCDYRTEKSVNVTTANKGEFKLTFGATILR